LSYATSGWVTFPLIALSFVIAARSFFVPGRPISRALDPAAWCLLGGFALIGLAFTLSARTPTELAFTLNFVMFLLLHPLTVMLARFAAPRNTLRVSALAFAACASGVLIAAFQVLVLAMPRAASFSDPIWSAQAVIAAGFIALAGSTLAPGRWKIPLLLAPVFATGVAVLSGSRGPLLAVPVLAVVFVVLNVRRWWLFVALAVALLALGLGATALVWPAGWERLSSMATIATELFTTGRVNEQSGHERQLMYETAWPAFLDAPWVGHGWARMLDAIAPYLPNGLATFAQVHLHLHSDLLDFAVSGGVLGLVAYGLILVGPVAAALGSPRDTQFRFRLTATSVLSAGYFLFGLTYLLFGYEYHTTLFVCLNATILGYCRDRPPTGAAASRSGRNG